MPGRILAEPAATTALESPCAARHPLPRLRADRSGYRPDCCKSIL